MNTTIITIQGIDLWGNRVADRFLSQGAKDTERKMRSFANRYHLVNVEVI